MMRNFYCRLWLAGLIVSALQTQAMGIDMSVYGPDTVVNKQSGKLFAKGMLRSLPGRKVLLADSGFVAGSRLVVGVPY